MGTFCAARYSRTICRVSPGALDPMPASYPAAFTAARMQKSCSLGSSRTFPADGACERPDVGASNTITNAVNKHSFTGRANKVRAEFGKRAGFISSWSLQADEWIGVNGKRTTLAP